MDGRRIGTVHPPMTWLADLLTEIESDPDDITRVRLWPWGQPVAPT
jgi:hypothetical protein